MKYWSQVATFVSCIGGFMFGYDIGTQTNILIIP